MLTQLITETYAGCFEAVYLWSPSVRLDPAYDVIKSYVERKLKPQEEWLFEHFDPADLQRVIDEQAGIIKIMKEDGRKKRYACAVILDDFADSPEVTRNSKLLWSLAARGRHMHISLFCLTQRWRALAPILRLNCSFVTLSRINNTKDADAIAEELGNLAGGKQEFLAAYHEALDHGRYSFLLVDLQAAPSKSLRIGLEGTYL